jgi:hypothetical protein
LGTYGFEMGELRVARLFQAAFLLAWLLAAVAITGLGSLGFLAPAGLFLVALGTAVLFDWGAVRSGLHRVQRDQPLRYPPPERLVYWRLYGAGITLIGAVWAAAGVAAAAT